MWKKMSGKKWLLFPIGTIMFFSDIVLSTVGINYSIPTWIRGIGAIMLVIGAALMLKNKGR